MKRTCSSRGTAGRRISSDGSGETGSGSIRTAVLLLAAAAVLSAVLFYGELMSVASSAEKRVRLVLDSCLMKESIAIYSDLDDGHDASPVPDREYFREAFFREFPTFSETDDGLCISGDGSWAISMPVLSSPDPDHLKLAADYTLVWPVRFAGITLFEARIDMRTECRYVSKFE
ncbi:MAG: hypothetical protein ILP01_02715 [Clostridia bacterium]|nr:hypothetical protein [Clostridia bacterium]